MIILRKWAMAMGAGILTLGLAACSDTAEPAAGSEGEKGADSDLTLEEVFTKTNEASEEINSLHADMVTSQMMTVESAGMEIETVSDISMDMTMEPMAFYQTGETKMNSEEMGDMPPMTMEMYYTEEGMYMFEPTMETWMKMPSTEMEQLQTMMDQQTADPSKQMEELEAFKDDFTFEQTADDYVLKLNASGEEYQELIGEQMEQMLGQMDMEVQTVLEGMTINDVAYEIFIDKETFLPSVINIDMDLDMEIEGESMNIKSVVDSEYSKYDEIDSITVPAEVIEQAQEI
ncbi:DUF6612 family protein [Planococcus sp. NCCP-2050]|uniref:DUF6612 family protein n=1 Tax=Planococcus sp. NCCP-2050 TaxID=2944679 RepID=UPI0020413E91|nr:DUF6612 family protein [Planococcus sp. NCCP-2050]